jgi:acyl-coenzyme A thioesterase PaaI-like protein
VDHEHLKRRRRVAASLRRLNNYFVTSDLDDQGLDAMATTLDELATSMTPVDVAVRKKLRGRSFFRAPRHGDDPLDQSLFEDSPFSGASSPISNAVRFWMDGDVAHCEAVLDAIVEGAHERSHGGVVAGLVDELMGVVISHLQEPAFTGELKIQYRAATPIYKPISGQAQLVKRDGRRLYLEASLEAEGRTIVEATALFILVDVNQFGGPGHPGDL